MSKKTIYVVDIMREIVDRVSAKLTSKLKKHDSLIKGLHYDHGHPLEIIETLKQKDASETLVFNKYPAVFLFQDFTETMGEPGVASNARLHILIVASTSREYKAAERYEKNFKPILYPIYTELLTQIFKSGKVMVASESKIVHDKIDRVFWGRESVYGNQANLFNDYLDAIEIPNMNLKFYEPVCIQNCCTTK